MRLAAQRLILITGDEAVLRHEALDGILAEVPITKDDFDLQSFDGDGAHPRDWAAAASTAPFLADRRVALVRHVLRCDPEKAKTVPFEKLPENGLLILVADEDGTGETGKRDTAWRNLVRKAGGLVLEVKSDPKKVKDQVRARVTEMGKTLSPRAADTLLEMTGGSLSRALDELEKLVVYVGKASQISESDVQLLTIPSRDWNVFRMVDGIVAGDVPSALRQLRTLSSAGKAADTAAYSQILPMVSRSLRLLYQARVCLDARVSPENAPPEVVAMFPAKPNLASEPTYRQARLMETAGKVRLPQIQRAMAILSDTDARLKGLLPAFSATETLERMLLEMADALAPARRR